MTYILNKARSYPVITFFILAYVLTWIITPLVAISPIFGLPGLLMPAISAVITKKMMEGWPGVQDLLRRLILWKIGAGWYFFAIGFPIVVSLIVMYLGVLLGAPNQIQFSPISALSIFVFILVVGEEIGWRGYALPKMLDHWPALQTSLVLGVLWGLWHLPTFFKPGFATGEYSIPGISGLHHGVIGVIYLAVSAHAWEPAAGFPCFMGQSIPSDLSILLWMLRSVGG
jgi:uncharacterized protein